MRKLLVTTLILFAPLSFASSLYTLEPHKQQGSSYPISLKGAAHELRLRDIVELPLPNMAEPLRITVTETSEFQGVVSLIGVAKGVDLSITIDGTTLFGNISTAQTRYVIENIDGQNFLRIPVSPKQRRKRYLDNDYVIPPKRKENAAKETDAQLKSRTVDLMILHNREISALFLNTLNARLQQQVSELNQMASRSNISGRFSLVHIEETQFSNTVSTSTALNALQANSGEFVGVNATRDRVGADIVVLLRAHRGLDNCGQAFLNGSNQGSISRSDRDFAFAVVGFDQSNRVCDNATLAHEIGHVMGLVHHDNIDGVFPFSKGFSDGGRIDTIMSVAFTGPQQFRFSNPNQECLGRPCGIVNSVDASRSMNAVFASVANFTSAAVISPNDQPVDSVLDSELGTEAEPEPTITPILQLLLDDE